MILYNRKFFRSIFYPSKKISLRYWHEEAAKAVIIQMGLGCELVTYSRRSIARTATKES